MRLVIMVKAMQLVLMVTLLTPAGAELQCGLAQCRLMDRYIEVESCGIREQVVTKVCAGNCYHQDLVYVSDAYSPQQKVCTGIWHYEHRLIQDCPIPARYLVASSCTCGPCPTGDSDCERFNHDPQSCWLF